MNDELIAFISTVGFPIVVAVYLLVTLNKTLKELTSVISANTLAIEKLCLRSQDKNALG